MRALILALALAAIAAPATAQQLLRCADRAAVVAQLTGAFGESVTASGLAGGGLAELWVAPSGGWTLTLTLPDGRACLLAGGTEWGPVAVVALPPNL